MEKRRDLIKDLRKYGIQIYDHGGRHSKLINPINSLTSSLPAYKEINDFTANEIFKKLQISHRRLPFHRTFLYLK